MKKVLFLFLAVSSGLLAQDYKADLQKIIQDFQQLEEYRIVSKVSVEGEESYSFTASIDNSKKYGVKVKVDAVEFITNASYSINIDHEDRTVQVQKGDFKDAGKRMNNDDGLDQINESIQSAKQVKFKGASGDLKYYELSGDNSDQKTIITISKKTGFFHSFEVFFKSDDVSIESYKVVYSVFEKSPNFHKSNFDESQVFQKLSSGNIKLIEKFKNYEIIRA